MATTWRWAHLVRHADLIARLTAAVESSPQLRWLEICCSLASGRGDERSDVDAGVGYGDEITPALLDEVGSAIVGSVGSVADMLVQAIPGWPLETRRFAVEFENDLQLDLVLMPAGRRLGLPTGAVAVVDKDGHLSTPWQPPVERPPTVDDAREWLMLGWWALSDVAKYLARDSLFEAVERMVEARQQTLKLYAVGAATPFPSLGLVSLLDFPPHTAPDGLLRTYATPSTVTEVLSAAVAIADLLEACARSAGYALGAELATSWASIARRRLGAAADQ